MRAFFLAAFLLLLGSGLASAQELFPIQTVPVSGPGCQDADTLSVVAPWAKCHPELSDDFDRDGGVLNTAKWRQVGVGNPGVSPCTTTDGPVILDNQGVHWKNINTGGNNYTESGDLFWHLPGLGGNAPFYPSGDFVLEYEVASVSPANNNQNYWVNWIWGKDASAGAEVDIPEDETFSWIYWTPTWQPGGGYATDKQAPGYETRLTDGHSHIVDLIRKGSTWTMLVDNGPINGNSTSFTSPYPVFNDSTNGINLYAGNEAGVCFPWDDAIKYIHVGY